MDKSITIIGEDKEKTIIDCKERIDTTILISADFVNINGFTIKNSNTSIGINSNNNIITNNIILNNGPAHGMWKNYFGIYLFDSNNTIISYNSISGNDYSLALFFSNLTFVDFLPSFLVKSFNCREME